MPSPPTPVVIVPGRPGLTRLDIDALTPLRISHRLCARLLHLEHAGGARLSRIILTELSAFGTRLPAPSLAQHPRRASRSFPCVVPLVPHIVTSVCLCAVCSQAEDAPRRRVAPRLLGAHFLLHRHHQARAPRHPRARRGVAPGGLAAHSRSPRSRCERPRLSRTTAARAAAAPAAAARCHCARHRSLCHAMLALRISRMISLHVVTDIRRGFLEGGLLEGGLLRGFLEGVRPF